MYGTEYEYGFDGIGAEIEIAILEEYEDWANEEQ